MIPLGVGEDPYEGSATWWPVAAASKRWASIDVHGHAGTPFDNVKESNSEYE